MWVGSGSDNFDTQWRFSRPGLDHPLAAAVTHRKHIIISPQSSGGLLFITDLSHWFIQLVSLIRHHCVSFIRYCLNVLDSCFPLQFHKKRGSISWVILQTNWQINKTIFIKAQHPWRRLWRRWCPPPRSVCFRCGCFECLFITWITQNYLTNFNEAWRKGLTWAKRTPIKYLEISNENRVQANE